MIPSLIRTLTPFVVGFALTQAAQLGIDLDEGVAEQVTVVVLGGVYYLFARLAEAVHPALGRWLLSLNTVKATPKYERPMPPKPEPLPPRIDMP